MHLILGSHLSQGFLFLQQFLNHFGLEGRCILLSHHTLVYLISGPSPVQILGSSILSKISNLVATSLVSQVIILLMVFSSTINALISHHLPSLALTYYHLFGSMPMTPC